MIKKLLGLVFCCFLISFSITISNASHLMGGEIVLKHITGNDYEVQANIYRDSAGVSMPTSIGFGIIDHNTATYSGGYFMQMDTTYGIGFNTQKGIFTRTISLPSVGDFEFYWSSCCRNGSIVNITNPSSQHLWVGAKITSGLNGGNSSPFFLNDPVITAAVGVQWNYNPLPFDPDGDSLVYTLSVPLSNDLTQVTGYVPPSGSAPFVINPLTGVISWTPNMLGNFQAAVLVEEYRNGIKIGHVRRDMQISVIQGVPGNGPNTFTNTNGWNKNVNEDFQFGIPAESEFHLTIGTMDPDNDRVSLIAVGEPLLLNNNPATFNLTAGLPKHEEEGLLYWQPDLSQIRGGLYSMVFRKTEYIQGFSFSEDLTVLLEVNNLVNTTRLGAEFQLQAYPNPASQQIQVGFLLEQSGMTSLSVFSNTGQLVYSKSHELSSGAQIIPIDLKSLETGNYYLHVEQNGMSSSVPITIK